MDRVRRKPATSAWRGRGGPRRKSPARHGPRRMLGRVHREPAHEARMGKNWPYALLAVLVLLAPLAGSWYAARQWSQQAEFDQTHLMALSVLRRAEAVAEQAEAAAEPPVSRARRAAVFARQPRADARDRPGIEPVAGCGLRGRRSPAVFLAGRARPAHLPGAAALHQSARGLELRTALHLPLTPGRTRVVGVRNGTAVVLAPELITELVCRQARYRGRRRHQHGREDRRTRRVLAAVAPAPGPGDCGFVRRRARVVSLQRSSRFDLVTYVVVPVGNTNSAPMPCSPSCCRWRCWSGQSRAPPCSGAAASSVRFPP